MIVEEVLQISLIIFKALIVVVPVVWTVIKIIHFFQNRKERKLRIERDISIKETEFEQLRLKHQQEKEDMEGNFEGTVKARGTTLVDLRTEDDRHKAARLFEKQRSEEERVFAELGHLYELRGDKSFSLMPESKIRQFCNKILNLFN